MQDAIENQAKLKIDKLQAEIDALNSKGNAVSSSSTYTAKKSPLESIYADLNSLLQDIETNRPGKANTEDQRLFESLMKDLRKIDPAAAAKINPAGTGLRHPKAIIKPSE